MEKVIRNTVCLLALHVLLKFISLLPYWDEVFGNSSIWVNFDSKFNNSNFEVIFFLLAFFVIPLTLIRPRFFTPLFFLFLMLADDYCSFVFNGSVYVMINILFIISIYYILLLIKPKLETNITIPAILALRLSVVCVYLVAGIGKLFAIEWTEGVALKYMLLNGHFNMMPAINDWLASSPLIISIGTYSFMIFELSFIAVLFSKRLRFPIFISGAFFHIGGYFLLGIEGFPFVMLTSYILFFEDQELVTWGKGFRGINKLKRVSVLGLMPKFEKSLILIFDQDCLMCNAFVRRIMDADKKEEILFSSQNSTLSLELIKQNKLSKEEVHVIAYGSIYSGMDALFVIADRVGGWYNLLFAFRYFPQWMRQKVYRLISKFRKISNKVGSNTCSILSPKQSRRIIS
jgi:predicted DCC family thiol-disulfide oxidoreductase YuxK